AGKNASFHVDADSVWRVPGRVQDFEAEVSDLQNISMRYVDVDMRRGRMPLHHDFRIREPRHVPSSGQVVGVGVGVDQAVKPDSVIGCGSQITRGVFAQWIDQRPASGAFTSKQIRLALSTIELTKQHAPLLNGD